MCVVTDCTVMLSSGLTHVYICPCRKVQFLPPPARTAIGLHDYERGTRSTTAASQCISGEESRFG